MERPAGNESGYETAVIPLAAEVRDPFLLAWGTTDDNVHTVHSERWGDALIAAGRTPGVLHSIAILTSERREIKETEWLIADIRARGVAAGRAEAEARPVPAFSGSPE